MNTSLKILAASLIAILVALLTGRLSNPSADKFLDYGSGIINLHQATMVTTDNNNPRNINPPGFRPQKIYIEFSEQLRSRFTMEFTRTEKMNAAYAKIQDFLKSGSSYLKVDVD